MMKDYDFFGKSSTGLGLNWLAVDGERASANAPTLLNVIVFYL